MLSKVDSSLIVTELDKVVIKMILVYGLRISEILRLTRLNLLPGSKLLIEGLKRSNNRIIDNVVGYDVLKNFLLHNYSIESIYSRFYFYRLFKKIGIYVEIQGNEKKAVTHAGRHIQVRMLSEANIDIEDTKHYISHKSVKSTEHYEKGKIKGH